MIHGSDIAQKNFQKELMLPLLKGSPDRAFPNSPGASCSSCPRSRGTARTRGQLLTVELIILNVQHGAFPALSAPERSLPSSLWQCCPCRAATSLGWDSTAPLNPSQELQREMFLPATGKRGKRLQRRDWRSCSLGNQGNF